jgi:hypothetical protein
MPKDANCLSIPLPGEVATPRLGIGDSHSGERLWEQGSPLAQSELSRRGVNPTPVDSPRHLAWQPLEEGLRCPRTGCGANF